MMGLRMLVVMGAALLLTACNPMAQLDSAEERIAKFHEVYNAGDARALYGLTSDEFRGATTPEQMEELVATVTTAMGTVESTERSGFNLKSENGQSVTSVTMTTKFAKGEGTETYTFFGSGEDLRIVGWHVDSPNFLNVPAEAVTLPERVIETPPGE